MFQDERSLFIGLVLEGFLYGFYSGIFVMYLQYQASKKDTDKKQNIIFYSICVLYVLSVALFVVDIPPGMPIYPLLSNPTQLVIIHIEAILFGCCEFIAQFILIYRCWIVWGRNIRIVIIPSILAFVCLVTWLMASSFIYISSGNFITPTWAYLITLLSLALSLTVNALVMGLIVFRIFKMFREVRATLDDQILGTTGGSKLRCIILVLIESGMTLFSVQLVRLVVTIVGTEAATRAFCIIPSIHDMLVGITPTIILVRTSMGLSFHDEESMEEVAIGSLRFVPSHPNSVSEAGSIGIVRQDSRDDDIQVGIQRSNDIDIVEG